MTGLYYFLTVFFSATHSIFTKRNGKQGGSVLLFMLIRSTVSLLLFSLLFVNGVRFDRLTLIIAPLYGIFLSVSMFAGYQALKCGPMGLTSALVAFSLVVPLVYGLLNGEKLSVFGCMGLALIVVSVILINKTDKRSDTSNVNLKWFLLTAVTALMNGFCSVVQKYHQTVVTGGRAEFMWLGTAVCTVVFLVSFCIKLRAEKTSGVKGCFINGSIAGATNGASGFLTLTLSAVQNAAVLFPIVSVATLASSLLCGRLFFREIIKSLQYAGVLTAAAAIVLLGI